MTLPRPVTLWLPVVVWAAMIFTFWAIGRDAPALLLASAYAVTDEFHQTFVPGRHGTPVDWAIDTAGALLGLALLRRRW